MPIKILPQEVLVEIIEHTNPQPWDLQRLRCTSRQFREAASENQLWRQFSHPENRNVVAKSGAKNVVDSHFQRLSMMPPKERKILKGLWDGTVEQVGIDNIVQNYPKHWDIVSAATARKSFSLAYACPEFKSELSLARLVLGTHPNLALHILDKSVWEIESFVLDVVRIDPDYLRFAPAEIQNNKRVVEASVKKNGCTLEYAGLSCREDENIVRSAVAQNGMALQFAAPTLQDNRSIVQLAVESAGYALAFAGKHLQKDRDIVMNSLRKNGDSIRFASEDLRGDKEVALEAVRQSGTALSHLSDALKSDREVVLSAVRTSGMALVYADPKYAEDMFIVSEAIQNSVYGAYRYVSPIFKNKKEFTLDMVRKDGRCLIHVPEHLRLDRDVTRAAIKNDIVIARAYSPLKYDNELFSRADNASTP